MDDFIDNEAEFYDDAFDVFEQNLFQDEPVNAPELAPIIEDENEDRAVDLALHAADSDEQEDENVAAEEAEAASVSASVLQGAQDVTNLRNYVGPAQARPRLIREVATEEFKAKKAALNAAIIARIPKRKTLAARAVSNLVRRHGDAVSVWTKGTIAKKFLVPGIRLEELSADTQAKIIHGDTNFRNATAKTVCCALCGFKFENRGSMRSGKVKELAISYDHFIPINFAAIVFRIVSSVGKYSDDEFKILQSIGDMVCWHCNYTKGQAMFITCPTGSGGTFDNLKVNTPVITKFFTDLLTSKSIWAYNTADKSRTSLSKCIDLRQDEWLSSRIAATTARATQVINLIKENVDFEKAKQRLGLARATVRTTLQGLEGEEKWQKLQRDMRDPQADTSKCMKSMLRFRRELVARAFAREEVSYPLPWKRIKTGVLENAEKPFIAVRCEPEPNYAKKARSKTAGAKTRRRRLPKLV
jgi:hypothetical protein